MTDINFTIPPKGIVIKQWPSHIDNIGRLSPVEIKDLPFVPRRFFIVDKVPADSQRGGHAHKITKQYLFCVKGLILVLLNDGKQKTEFKLKEGQGTLVQNMVWDSQKFMTGEDVLLVLCSTEYDSADYITDFGEFKKIVNKKGKERMHRTS